MNPDTGPSLFDQHLVQETLRSERMRARILAGATAAIIVTLLALPSFDNSAFIAALRASDIQYKVLLPAGGLILYELLLQFMLGKFIHKNGTPPLAIRYFNAFLETSIPTVAIILFAQAFDPISALISVAPFMYFVFIVLSTLRLEFWLCAFTGFIAGAEYFSLAWYYLSGSTQSGLYPMLQAHVYYLVKAVIMLITGVLAGFVSIQVKHRIVRSVRALEERNAVIRLFGQHASPEVVNELLNTHTEPQSARKHVCVVFVDIRGFTQFAEQRAPEETVSFLNTMFEFMIESVTRNHGIVHQLLGDGLMAIFGAPLSSGNDTENGVRAAMEIIGQMQREADAGRIPPTRLGIGIHAGEVVAGTVGSALHKEYKVTGDVVNLASRIEQLNKEFDTQLLVSANVWHAIRDTWSNGKSRGMVSIRGVSEPVEIYELAR